MSYIDRDIMGIAEDIQKIVDSTARCHYDLGYSDAIQDIDHVIAEYSDQLINALGAVNAIKLVENIKNLIGESG